MVSQFIRQYSFFALLVFIFIASYYIQADTYINMDMGWFLEAAQRMLKGGTYSKDFFENNPPWILYLSIPPILFSKMLTINLVLSFRLYVWSFALVSLILSYVFLKRTFIKSDIYLARYLTIVFAFLFLIVPAFEFGQREHLFFMLVMPYLLLLEQRLAYRIIPVSMAVLVGFLAGLVFLLKPYFLMTLFLIEIYHAYRKKSLSSLIRPETISIAIMLVIYVAIIALYHRDYLTVVVPIALRYCYFGSRNPLVHFLFTQFCIHCYLSIIFCLLTYKINRYPQLTILFILAFIGFFFSYVVQQENVYYRLIPAYGMAFIIFMFALANCISSASSKFMRVYQWMFYFSLVVFLYLKRSTYLLDFYPLFYPLSSLFFLTTIYLLVLYLLPSTIKLRVEFYLRFLIAFILLCGFFYTYRISTELEALILCLLVIVLYGCLLPTNHKIKMYVISFIFLTAVMLLLPLFQLFAVLNITHRNKTDYEALVQYINAQIPSKSYSFFLTSIPNYMEYKAHSASRFSFFWYLPGLVKQSYFLKDHLTDNQYALDKKFFIDMVAEDLINNKPQWVLVDVSTKKSYLFWRTGDEIKLIPFDYLQYFNDNQKFKDVWKNYHYFKTISTFRQHPLNPYQYQLHLSYHIPESDRIQFPSLYLYLNDKNHLEIAFKDHDRHTRRIVVTLNESDTRHIKDILKTRTGNLTILEKRNFNRWMLKQTIQDELYKFDIYQLEP